MKQTLTFFKKSYKEKLMRAVYPRTYADTVNGGFISEIVDKKLGKVWSSAHSFDRGEAIKLARQNMPRMGFIKRAIGWIDRHPMLAGALVGATLAIRRRGNILLGVIGGALASLLAKKSVKLALKVLGYQD